ncbi:MAG: heme lyase CcmF/NrfE family subunit, partial [Burkholderiales bacterium]
SLIYAHVTSDFSVMNVYQHSHTLKPLLYKVTGTWGNHEGSMLLWAWILVSYSAAFMCLAKGTWDEIRLCLTVQALLTAGFLSFILFTSNPFARLNPAPLEGQGLNPLLQDIGLALHPPMLYSGYVGFSIIFSAAIMALWRGRCDQSWLIMVRPWLLIAWSFLTLGIGLGSWWAYRELGWGGFWFWDPVENASLMPWLLATALLHMLIVNWAKQAFYGWTILLALLTFIACLLGTFLVRSGVLTSVHSFANDPQRGIYILMLLFSVTFSGFVLFAKRVSCFKAGKLQYLFSKEAFLLGNNVLLIAATLTILLGTLYPMFYEWLAGRSLTVGMPYFVKTFVPIAVLALLLA